MHFGTHFTHHPVQERVNTLKKYKCSSKIRTYVTFFINVLYILFLYIIYSNCMPSFIMYLAATD